MDTSGEGGGVGHQVYKRHVGNPYNVMKQCHKLINKDTTSGMPGPFKPCLQSSCSTAWSIHICTHTHTYTNGTHARAHNTHARVHTS